MNTIKKIGKLLFVALITFVGSSFSGDQGKGCDLESLFESNAANLQPYTFMKKFDVKVDKSGEKIEYSYVLSRDSEYKIMIFDMNEEGKKMVVNFYDRNKKLIASNYLKSSKKIFPSITYKCAATGVYYIEAYFEGEKNGCGINVFGFKK
ncbi:MAG: hypothetical protein Q8M29_13540 [Bacteroidota bacterium]|nr:hypothetical protein [Bacteroidota bacterium]